MKGYQAPKTTFVSVTALLRLCDATSTLQIFVGDDMEGTPEQVLFGQ